MVSFPSRFKRKPSSVSSNRTLVSPEPPTASPNTGSENDWELVDEDGPTEEEQAANLPEVQLEVHPLRDPRGVLVSVVPPKEPPTMGGKKKKKRCPVDIVMVVDVSLSMGAVVEVPNRSEEELFLEHTVISLVKNAAEVVVESLDEKDRVGVVTFGHDAIVLRELTQMTPEARVSLLKEIEDIKPYGATNLWAGLQKGYRLFSSAPKRPTAELPEHALATMYLLTDGMPNVMPPMEGYIPALRKLVSKETEGYGNTVAPTIHTFGFGYEIRSGLLQAIAEVGGGYFGFVSDCNMLATCFGNASANLYVTFTKSVTLKVTTSGCSGELKPPNGAAIMKHIGGTLEISLYNLQYGQSRDVFLVWPKDFDIASNTEGTISATLEYTKPGHAAQELNVTKRVSEASTSLDPSVAYYHFHRAKVCKFLASLSRLNVNDEYIYIGARDLGGALAKLSKLVRKIKTSGYNDDLNSSLLHDLDGDLDKASHENPEGQVLLALSQAKHFDKWGVHFLPSLLHAHRYQVRINFKDPGPRQYMANAPHYAAHIDALDSLWELMQDRILTLNDDSSDGDDDASGGSSSFPTFCPPTTTSSSSFIPDQYHWLSSGLHSGATGGAGLARYNRIDNPCFLGHCAIALAHGTAASIPIRDLRPGHVVRTPAGPRRVAAVVKTTAARGEGVAVCRLGGLWVTPWHPVRVGEGWVWPVEAAEGCAVVLGRSVYSVLLERGGAEGHAVMVGGVWCVTLGHGVVDGDDVRAHGFFGDWERCVGELKGLPRGRDGVVRCGGVKRDGVTGFACGFKRPSGEKGAGARERRVRGGKM